MKVDGRCLCGFIRFEAVIDPAQVRICHCTDCQLQTGSAYRVNVPADHASFRLSSGRPKVHVKTAESGRQRAQAFCPECGSSIYSTAPAGEAPYMLRVGTLTQRAALAPKLQQWCRSALPWASDLHALPQIDAQPPA